MVGPQQPHPIISSVLGLSFRSSVADGSGFLLLAPKPPGGLPTLCLRAKGGATSFSSVTLDRDDKGQYKWGGDWAGSANQKPKYQHAFICEKTAKRKLLLIFK